MPPLLWQILMAVFVGICNGETQFLEHYERKLNSLHMRMNGGKPVIINGKLKRFKCIEEYVSVDENGIPIGNIDDQMSHSPAAQIDSNSITPSPTAVHLGGVKTYRRPDGQPPLPLPSSEPSMETSRSPSLPSDSEEPLEESERLSNLRQREPEVEENDYHHRKQPASPRPTNLSGKPGWELALRARILNAERKKPLMTGLPSTSPSSPPPQAKMPRRGSGKTSQENSNELGMYETTQRTMYSSTGKEVQFQELNMRRSPSRNVDEEMEGEEDDEVYYAPKRRRRPIADDDEEREEYYGDYENDDDDKESENHINSARYKGHRGGGQRKEPRRALPIRYISANDLPSFARFPKRYNTRMMAEKKRMDTLPMKMFSQSTPPTPHVGNVPTASPNPTAPFAIPTPTMATTMNPLPWLNNAFTLLPTLASGFPDMTKLFRLPTTSPIFATTTPPPPPPQPQHSTPPRGTSTTTEMSQKYKFLQTINSRPMGNKMQSGPMINRPSDRWISRNGKRGLVVTGSGKTHSGWAGKGKPRMGTIKDGRGRGTKNSAKWFLSKKDMDKMKFMAVQRDYRNGYYNILSSSHRHIN